MRRALLVSLAAAWLVIGCGATRQMYDGPKLESDSIAILKLNLDSGARVVRIDDRAATEADNDDIGPACFKGKIALLPGEHVLEIVYHDTYYNQTDAPTNQPSMTVLTSADHKELTFTAVAGHSYRVEASSEPIEWPPNSITWKTWVVDLNLGSFVVAAE